MNESLGEYITRDGKSLSFRKWHGTLGVILFIHGVESHAGWFKDFIAPLAANNFTIYGIDRRGSGMNTDSRGDIENYNTFFDDIEDAVNFVKSQHPGEQVYLMGICWGGLLAVNYVSDRRPAVNGLILLSPAIYRKIDFSFCKTQVAKICQKINPAMRFNIPIKDEMFTDNLKYKEFIGNDSMRLRTLTVRFFSQIVKMEKDFSEKNHKIDLPVLVLLAGHDDIVDNEKVKEWFSRITSTDKDLREFPDFYHVMPFENEKSSLANYISDWIISGKARVGSQDI